MTFQWYDLQERYAYDLNEIYELKLEEERK